MSTKIRKMSTTPGRSGKGKQTNNKHLLLRKLAEQKRAYVELLKANGEVRADLPNELEYWLFMYSELTIERLNNELLKMENEGNHTS